MQITWLDLLAANMAAFLWCFCVLASVYWIRLTRERKALPWLAAIALIAPQRLFPINQVRLSIPSSGGTCLPRASLASVGYACFSEVSIGYEPKELRRSRRLYC
jgi:hypothetical protein